MSIETDKVCTLLAQQIDKVVNNRLDKAGFDKTYIGIISEVCFDENTATNNALYQKYKVFYNNSEQDVYIKDGLIHSVGDKLLVTLPMGKVKDKYVEMLTKNHPSKIVYNNETDEIIETWTNNLGKYVYRTYSLVIENKGTENELVKTLIYPDGTEMDLSEFTVND